VSDKPQVHIVGAGLAGLSAALRLAESGHAVTLYEAAPQAGGRCRSYFDKQLGVTVDNGNHLLLSGNPSALAFLRDIGAEDPLIDPGAARYPFVDLANGRRYEVTLSEGRIPWWVLDAKRRVPGTRLADYLSGIRLARAGAAATVAEVLPKRDALWRAFYAPLTVAALNTQPQEASAQLLWTILSQSFLKGASHARPLIARHSLGESFIAPAIRRLEALGVTIRFGWRLRGLERTNAGDALHALDFDRERVPLNSGARLVLAVPPWNLDDLLPELPLTLEPRPIVNAHMVLPDPAPLPPDLPLLGVIGGTVEWIFARGSLVSLTVSAAESLDSIPQEDLKARLWADTAAALSLQQSMPPIRIVREKRATFAATPGAAAQRPGAVTDIKGVYLAGDWTDTGLPSTIEGAVRSGEKAAHAIRHNASAWGF